jgi:hypothetical protein
MSGFGATAIEFVMRQIVRWQKPSPTPPSSPIQQLSSGRHPTPLIVKVPSLGAIGSGLIEIVTRVAMIAAPIITNNILGILFVQFVAVSSLQYDSVEDSRIRSIRHFFRTPKKSMLVSQYRLDW